MRLIFLCDIPPAQLSLLHVQKTNVPISLYFQVSIFLPSDPVRIKLATQRIRVEQSSLSVLLRRILSRPAQEM